MARVMFEFRARMREVELRSAPFFRGTQGNPAGIRVEGKAFFGDFLWRQKVTRHSRVAAGEMFLKKWMAQ